MKNIYIDRIITYMWAKNDFIRTAYTSVPPYFTQSDEERLREDLYKYDTVELIIEEIKEGLENILSNLCTPLSYFRTTNKFNTFYKDSIIMLFRIDLCPFCSMYMDLENCGNCTYRYRHGQCSDTSSTWRQLIYAISRQTDIDVMLLYTTPLYDIIQQLHHIITGTVNA